MPKTVSTMEFFVDQLSLANRSSVADRVMNITIAEEMSNTMLAAGYDVNQIYAIIKARPRPITNKASSLRKTARPFAYDPGLRARVIRAEYRRHPLEMPIRATRSGR